MSPLLWPGVLQFESHLIPATSVLVTMKLDHILEPWVGSPAQKLLGGLQGYTQGKPSQWGWKKICVAIFAPKAPKDSGFNHSRPKMTLRFRDQMSTTVFLVWNYCFHSVSMPTYGHVLVYNAHAWATTQVGTIIAPLVLPDSQLKFELCGPPFKRRFQAQSAGFKRKRRFMTATATSCWSLISNKQQQ